VVVAAGGLGLLGQPGVDQAGKLLDVLRLGLGQPGGQVPDSCCTPDSVIGSYTPPELSGRRLRAMNSR
jgi:hypothetical protein